MLRRLAVAIGLLCGLIGSQLPEFAQQYRQRLGGALDELERIVAQFDAEAAAQSLSRVEGLARLAANTDALARDRGEAIAGDIARAERLARQQAAMRESGPITRLAAFVENFDGPTFDRAAQEFEPALPITGEAAFVGAIGLALGWFATHLLAWPFRRQRAIGQARRQPWGA